MLSRKEEENRRMEFNVADLFEAAVDKVPDREIVVCGDRRATFRELDNRANQVAHYYLSLGLGKGDHIGIYGYNSLEWVEAMLAAYKIRAIPININYRYVEDELRYLFDNADIGTLVFESRFKSLVTSVKDDMPKLAHLISFDGNCSDIGAVDFNRDGSKVVSAGIDGTVRQWDVATGKQVWATPKMSLPVISLDVSPDGKTVVTGTGDYKKPNEAGECSCHDLADDSLKSFRGQWVDLPGK